MGVLAMLKREVQISNQYRRDDMDDGFDEFNEDLL